LKTIFELKVIFYEFFHRLHVVQIGKRETPKVPYFLWALQYRPESSVKVLGEGRDEVEEILKVASNLPEGFFLAVKENALMIGSRSLGFYKILEENRKIILLDPNISSIELILQSRGVIGISGTILFEAALLNKPSCALGHPEFSAFLISNGWESSKTFFNKVAGNSFESPIKKISPYLAYVLNEGQDLDSLRDMDAERPLSDEILDHFAQKITSEIL
jgi:Capsule polysaccharide biosynthesis protein